MRVLLSRSDLDFLERLHLCPGGNEDLGRFEGDVNIAKHDVFKAVICSAPEDTATHVSTSLALFSTDKPVEHFSRGKAG